MFFCPDCHVSNRSDAKFCRKCGKSRSDLERLEDVTSEVEASTTSSISEERSDAIQLGSSTETRAHIDATQTVVVSETTELAEMVQTVTVTETVVDTAVETVRINRTETHELSTAESHELDVSQGAPEGHESDVSRGSLAGYEPGVAPEGYELDVSQGAPVLSVNIEHNESFSVPPAPPPEQTTPQCPSCWEPLRATDKFCCWCGEAQPNRVLPFMKLCLECSTFLPEKANYCYSCGTDVGYSTRKKVRAPFELFKDEDSEFFPRFDA